jgi:hypothetical protein
LADPAPPAGADPPPADDEAYFRDIEAHFRRLRGRHLFLSPLDVALVDSWWDAGVPLGVVLRALDQVFERRRAAGASRPVSSLSYCRHAVEEAFDEWRESRLGARRLAPGAAEREAALVPQAVAFLRARQAGLERAAASSAGAAAAVLTRAAGELRALAAGLDGAAPLALTEAEQKLEGIEDRLLDELGDGLAAADREALAEQCRREVEPLRARLTARAYEATLASRWRAALRSRFDLQRLSLYLL